MEQVGPANGDQTAVLVSERVKLQNKSRYFSAILTRPTSNPLAWIDM